MLAESVELNDAKHGLLISWRWTFKVSSGLKNIYIYSYKNFYPKKKKNSKNNF